MTLMGTILMASKKGDQMGDRLAVFKAAAVQASAVYPDREAIMRDATGDYRPKQFRVFFDDRELNALHIDYPRDEAAPDRAAERNNLD